MNINNIPKVSVTFERFNVDYERQHFRYAEANYHIGAATRDLLLGFYLPKFLWPLGKPFVYAMMDEPLLKAFRFPQQSTTLRYIVENALKLRGKLLRRLPERRQPHLGTQAKRPTYPEGYKIKELGTFGK